MQREAADQRGPGTAGRHALRYASSMGSASLRARRPADCAIAINPRGQFYVSQEGQFRMSLDTDIAVTSPDLERRFAGRLETGVAGSSNPHGLVIA